VFFGGSVEDVVGGEVDEADLVVGGHSRESADGAGVDGPGGAAALGCFGLVHLGVGGGVDDGVDIGPVDVVVGVGVGEVEVGRGVGGRVG